jgi:hypothetical protein
MTLGGPELELGIARRPNLQQRIVSPVVELEAGNRLGMAAIEIFRDSENGGEPPHDLAPLPSEQTEIRVPARRRRTPVIAGHERNRFDLVRLKSAKVAVFDQVVRVSVMAFVADVHARVVQDRSVFEPLALLVGHSVNGPGPIEERESESRDLVRMIRPVAATLGQFNDAASPHIGIAVRLRDLLAVFGDVVEDQTFAQRQVAQADLAGIEPFENRVEEDGAGHSEVGSSRVEARDFKPFLESE